MSRIVLDTNSLIQSIPYCKYVIELIINNPYTRFITPYFQFNLITADLDDNKFVDCAISANAKYIVTEDHHFDVLKRCDFPKVDIIRLEAFLDLI